MRRLPAIFMLTEFDADDTGLTLRMIHGRDLGSATPDGGIEYDYNFIDYAFPLAGGEAGARLYLDEPGTIYVRLSRAALGGPDAAAILRYLLRRFDRIMTLEAGIGYELSWVEKASAEAREIRRRAPDSPGSAPAPAGPPAAAGIPRR